jgi:hypothetical protein
VLCGAPGRSTVGVVRISSVLDAILAVGAATRLTRFVISEDLGKWVIRDPAKDWANPSLRLIRERDRLIRAGVPESELRRVEYRQTTEPKTWREKAVSGLDCPFCVGTWLHIGAQAISASLPAQGYSRTAWRVLAGGLTASWAMAHIGVRLGDAGYADHDD